jgi:hypothetical protein
MPRGAPGHLPRPAPSSGGAGYAGRPDSVAGMSSHRASRARAVAVVALLAALVPAVAACGGSSGGGATAHQAQAATTPSTAGGETTAGATGHTVFCGPVAGRSWSTNGKSGTNWDVSAMSVACATATHWAAILSTKDTQVLAGPAGYNCYAQVTGTSAPPIAGSCQAAGGAGNFTWQAAAY